MASISKTIFKIILILVINGAIMSEFKASADDGFLLPSPAPNAGATGDECYKNMKEECRKKVVETLCQEYHIPIEATMTDPCCEDIQANVNDKCLTTAMVKDVKKQCKLDKSLITLRSSQILSFCRDIDSPGIEEIDY